MVKLTANNTHSLNGNVLSQGLEAKPSSLNDSFLFDFQEFSTNLYVFRARDAIHELDCEMTLEVKEILVPLAEGSEEVFLEPAVFCTFPTINFQKLQEITGFDSYLQGILIFQFQLRILEQLLLFCEEKDAAHLTLIMSDTNLDYLEIYSRFFVSEERLTTPKSEQAQAVISAGVHIYDEVVDFIWEFENNFRKILWREQNTNPAFQKYLKSNACV